MRVRVVVIGGGAAGIAAARVLHDKNIEFVLLEAQGVLGGRIKETKFHTYTLEEGSNWIQGEHASLHSSPSSSFHVENPVWHWQRKYDIKGSFTNYSDLKVIRETGTQLSNEEMTEACWKAIEDAMVECTENAKNLRKQAEKGNLEEIEERDTTIKKCVKDTRHYSRSVCPTQIKEAFAWEEIEFETAIIGSSLMHTLPMNQINGIEYNDRDYLVTDPRGYSVFLREMAKSFDSNIKLNQIVTKVNYGKTSVKVETKAGLVVNADYAICTLPLGVLQNHAVTFDPPFRGDRLKGINKMKMALYSKITLKFYQKFWGDKEILMYTGDTTQDFIWAINLDHPKYFPGSNMIQFHVIDKLAKEFEEDFKMNKEVAINKSMTLVRKIFPDTKNFHVPDLEDIHVTNWNMNPYSYGSWSAKPIGYSKRLWNAMRRNDGRLYFAGEHTSENFGFVHAALVEGTKAVERLLFAMTAPEDINPSTGTTSGAANCSSCKKILLIFLIVIISF